MAYKIDRSARCAVVGYGSWATALVKILLENEAQVGWYVPRDEVREHLATHGSNPRYLRDVHFPPEKLLLSDDLDAVVAAADIVLLASPSAFLKATLEPLTVPLANKFVLSAIKGIVPGEYMPVAEYVGYRYGLDPGQVGVVTGPCHAEEVALERLSYLTVACTDAENAAVVGEKLRTPYINVSYSSDILGVEYAGVVKNIYSIAVGIAIGLGYGDNFLAVLISNGAMEMARFLGCAFPAGRDTNASAYLGDLLVTSYSQFSRNRTFGVMVGKGYSVRTAQIEMNMVAEGYYGAECVRQVNIAHRTPMPIAEAVHDILYNNAPVAATMKKLTKKLI